jgi:tol-pal system protein YbgF
VFQQAAQGQADQKAALDQVRARIEQLEQQEQELSRQQAELMNRLQSLQDTLETELTGIKARLDRLDGGAEAKPQPPGAPAPGTTPPAAKDFKEAYDLAVAQFKQKNYDAARAQFEAFLKAFPNTDLSDNAQFGIGECYFALAQYDKAVLEYDKVRRNYPAGNKVPNATWKMALAFEQLGQRDVAKGFLKELIEKFSKSPEAELARKKLASWP